FIIRRSSCVYRTFSGVYVKYDPSLIQNRAIRSCGINSSFVQEMKNIKNIAIKPIIIQQLFCIT
ncbi:hypothetical protein ACIXO6_22615, partial [Bacteroides fragilis]